MKWLVWALVVVIGVFVAKRFMSNGSGYDENVAAGQLFLDQNQQHESVVVTESGLQYQYLERGQGEVHPQASDKVEVHYHGTLIDGKIFDSSVDRKQTIEFGVTQVIKGWQEGLQLMVVGDKVRFTIPSDLAYGKRSAGSIPPGSVLVFDVELIAIK
ncbi:FKBP-type peptidyl-prolyl cis-trans isomerase [Alginatibacterium sediminis]|uniref:Peptidyl-prolyl cis-trans isomerase n=1 Tax=Alginatibacterium sediminis TaxID=2164068 RepID=A0A420E632_9ALTE|nr:FKBP-type peptidyl-prolyl cis-trans isomerase [Alginatibacterium sediminis]RKF13322.1 FKBP-type peptidyl-prolyl cis-trans isomerase [Alginatibacterium sediminis]